MPVVVVESPAKAKTINKYLGSDYTVLASYGHVRDLPSKDGSVDPENGFEMTWEVDSKSAKHVRAIAEAIKDDPSLILATDPDREGEAISWHLREALTKRRALKKDTPVQRVVFNAITKAAVTEAMRQPRAIDDDLVGAYLARRALDYLVGFNLSPVLWRKLPGARSAGRVQSVALRLIVEREMDGLVASLTDDDLARLRNKLATAVTLAGERPGGRMQRLGRTWLNLGEYMSLDEELERINAVTLDDLRAVHEAFPFEPRTTGVLVPG